MQVPKVENMESPRTGNPVANQFIITTYNNKGELVEIFQSYRTLIAVKLYGEKPRTLLDKDAWNYSITTSKYRNEFLGTNTAEARQLIKDGSYELVDLERFAL